MSSVHRGLSVALVSGFLAGACSTPAAHDAVPARVAADLTLVESAAAARGGGAAGDAGVFADRVAARADTMDTSLRWYIAAGRVGEALRFATAMSPFWRTQGRIDAGRRLMAAVLALPAPADQRRARARAWYEAGVLAFRQRDQEASRSANEQSLRIATAVGDTAAVGDGKGRDG